MQLTQAIAQAQTPQQRRANEKFQKEQEARRGKSEDQLKKKTKEVVRAPISPLWLGKILLQKLLSDGSCSN
jgi:hypothetical protein